MNLDEVNAYIHEYIPMTAAMGARVDSYDGRKVVVSAPLEPNLNHRNTAFGGSLAALGIVSGWVLLFLKLKECGIANRLVISRSSFDFLAPVEGAFSAVCQLPEMGEWEDFLGTLKRRGRSRINLHSEILGPGGAAGRHEGVYVAVVSQESENG